MIDQVWTYQMLNNMYEPLESYSDRAFESIKNLKQVCKRELDKKDEEIKTLKRKLELSQYESRENDDQKRMLEKENRELLSSNQMMGHELCLRDAEIGRLREENRGLKQNLTSQILYLQTENEKANHIIKNYLRTRTAMHPTHVQHHVKV